MGATDRNVASVPTAAVDIRRPVALALPAVMPAAMVAAFVVARGRLGDQGGYLTGFGAYWASCAALSLALLGPARIRALFGDRRPRLGRPALVGATCLAWPAAGAIATRFVPEIGSATPAMVATIAGVACVNTVLEELLWRGVYITYWPHDPWRGWIWPALGFAVWHLAPQTIHPSAMGPGMFVVASLALGLSWGWVAFRTGSLRLVSASHVLTDGSGLRSAAYFIGGG